MTTQYLKVADGAIAYDDQGAGPLILCLPAGGDLRSEYRFLTPLLVNAGYRVATMDLRGHGESSAYWPDYSTVSMGRDLLALIRHLEGGPAFVVGASKAVQSAVWAAVEAPEVVSGLALIAPRAEILPPWKMGLMANTLLAPWWGATLYAAWFPRLYPAAKPPDFDAHLASVRAMLKEPGRLQAVRRMFADPGVAADARVEQVAVPVLVIMGSRDPDARHPEQEARAFAARLTKATQVEVQVIEGAGHHPQTEVPEQIAQSLLAFLTAQQAIPEQ